MSALAGVGQYVAHEVDPATLPGAGQHLGDGGLDAFVGVGDDEPDPAQTAPGQATRRHAVQKVSASEGPTVISNASRRPTR